MATALRRALAPIVFVLAVASLPLACSVTALTETTPSSQKERPLTEVEREKERKDRDAGTEPEHKGRPPRYGDRVVREPLH